MYSSTSGCSGSPMEAMVLVGRDVRMTARRQARLAIVAPIFAALHGFAARLRCYGDAAQALPEPQKEVSMRCDLHVHSRFSGPATVPLLRHVCDESHAEPEAVYR